MKKVGERKEGEIGRDKLEGMKKGEGRREIGKGFILKGRERRKVREREGRVKMVKGKMEWRRGKGKEREGRVRKREMKREEEGSKKKDDREEKRRGGEKWGEKRKMYR